MTLLGLPVRLGSLLNAPSNSYYQFGDRVSPDRAETARLRVEQGRGYFRSYDDAGFLGLAKGQNPDHGVTLKVMFATKKLAVRAGCSPP